MTPSSVIDVRGAAVLVLGIVALAAVGGWITDANPQRAELFSWDSYSTHAIRMQHKIIYNHGMPVPGPLVLQRRLHDPVPESEGGDYPYTTNNGDPQRPSSAPVHDTRSYADATVWDGTQNMRNWGVPRDGGVHFKDCSILPRKDCEDLRRRWVNGDPIPEQYKQFTFEDLPRGHKDRVGIDVPPFFVKGPQKMASKASAKDGAQGAKRTPGKQEPREKGTQRTPGELEAKEFFETQDKADIKRQIGALRTQVQAVARALATPVVAAPAMYAGYPFYGGQRQGWNYGTSPLSAPGLGRAAVLTRQQKTIPDAIMKAFERDDKDWKPVMRKVKCTTCAIAALYQPLTCFTMLY
jgi:hypothetical protein